MSRVRMPTNAPERVLLALVALGLALRILASISSWPVSTTLDDGYQLYARSNPFMDQQHPAGYALILAALGAVTHRVAFTVVLQQLLGIVSALLLFGATRRVSGSAWAALLPAAAILLGADQIFLEHAIMSESWEVLAGAAGIYCAVRAFDAPDPWWRWPLLTGAAFAAGGMIRSAGLVMIPVAVVALLLSVRGARGSWRAPLAVAVTASVLLVAFAGANAAFGERFGITPAPGWYLYGRVAQFAQCKDFTAPPGTGVLCESRPQSERPTAYYYMYDPHAPAPAHLGPFGSNDGLIGTWAKRALVAQFGDFLRTGWIYLRGYFVPGSLPASIRAGSTGLDPQLDFTYANVFFEPQIKQSLEGFYAPFAVHDRHWGLRFLHDWQRVFRFGPTLLVITTVLTLLGLAIGTRRSRVAVLLFGVGGLALLVAPSLTSTYAGRYTVTMAGPMVAAAAVALHQISVRLRARARRVAR